MTDSRARHDSSSCLSGKTRRWPRTHTGTDSALLWSLHARRGYVGCDVAHKLAHNQIAGTKERARARRARTRRHQPTAATRMMAASPVRPAPPFSLLLNLTGSYYESAPSHLTSSRCSGQGGVDKSQWAHRNLHPSAHSGVQRPSLCGSTKRRLAGQDLRDVGGGCGCA